MVSFSRNAVSSWEAKDLVGQPTRLDVSAGLQRTAESRRSGSRASERNGVTSHSEGAQAKRKIPEDSCFHFLYHRWPPKVVSRI